MAAERSQLRRFVNSALITSVVIGGGLVVLRLLGVLQGLELDGYDRFIRWKPDEGIDERLLVVGVDEQDIQSLQEFPIHDGTLADVIAKVESYGPRMVGLDIGRDIPQGPAAGRERMIEELQNSDNLIAACLLSNELSPGVPAAPGVPDDRIAFSEFPEDPGGVVRRSILVSIPGPPPADQPVGTHLCNNPQPEFEIPSLALALAAGYLDAEGITVEGNQAGDLVIDGKVIPWVTERYGGYASTGAYDYQTMLNYRSAKNAVRQVNVTQLLAGNVDPAWIRDRIVLIGYTSSVAKDTFTTPYLAAQENLRQMNGVVVHAQATSQLLSAVLDQRPLIWAMPEILEWGWIWVWGLAGGAIALYLRRPWLFLTGGILAYVVCAGLHYGLFLQGAWLPVVPASIALVATGFATRLVDQANRQGYTQALYEQMKEQLTHQAASPQSERMNYLEDLVQRARAIRQAREGLPPTPLVEPDPLPPALPEVEAEAEVPVPPLLSDHDIQPQSHEYGAEDAPLSLDPLPNGDAPVVPAPPPVVAAPQPQMADPKMQAMYDNIRRKASGQAVNPSQNSFSDLGSSPDSAGGKLKNLIEQARMQRVKATTEPEVEVPPETSEGTTASESTNPSSATPKPFDF